MITKREYLRALNIIEKFHNQYNLNELIKNKNNLTDDICKNDYLEYIGGSESKYLTIGKKYRVIRYNINSRKIGIENDIGKRMVTNKNYFKSNE